MLYRDEYTTWAKEPEQIEPEGPALAGCPVLITAGLYELDATDREAADRMLAEHLKDKTRTCCDEHGFAFQPEFQLTSPAETHLEPIHTPIRRLTAPEYREVA